MIIVLTFAGFTITSTSCITISPKIHSTEVEPHFQGPLTCVGFLLLEVEFELEVVIGSSVFRFKPTTGKSLTFAFSVTNSGVGVGGVGGLSDSCHFIGCFPWLLNQSFAFEKCLHPKNYNKD